MTTIRRGGLAIDFSAEEWTCIRYCQAMRGHSGPGSVLTKGRGGDLGSEGIHQVRSLIERVRTDLLDQPLDESIRGSGGAAGVQLFELIARDWKLPYLQTNEGGRGSLVMRGTKSLGRLEEDPSLLQLVPRLRDIPAFMRAWSKLEALFDGAETATTAHVVID